MTKPPLKVSGTSLKQQIVEVAANYPTPRSAVMPALHLAQEHYGYLPQEALIEVAEALSVPKVSVLEIATFYSLYHTKPIGQCHLQLCTNISCMLRGAEVLQKQLEQRLDIHCGETTEDGQFTLTKVVCLGACEQAPVMRVNDEYIGNLDSEKLEELIKRLRLSSCDKKSKGRHSSNV